MHQKVSVEQLKQQIETLREQHGITRASIAVIDCGTIAWAKGFGMADLHTGRATSASTLLQPFVSAGLRPAAQT